MGRRGWNGGKHRSPFVPSIPPYQMPQAAKSFLPRIEAMQHVLWPVIFNLKQYILIYLSHWLAISYTWLSWLCGLNMFSWLVHPTSFSNFTFWLGLQLFLKYRGHSLRLNADVADTALLKSLLQFSKYWWPNLYYGKNYIFRPYIFNVKIHFFFGWKVVKCS